MSDLESHALEVGVVSKILAGERGQRDSLFSVLLTLWALGRSLPSSFGDGRERWETESILTMESQMSG